MDILTRQKIEKQDLSIFIRDLSKDVNINLSHMIEDILDEEKVKNVIVKNKKPKQLKKKDIIIMEQNKIRFKKNIEDDMGKVPFFIENMDIKDPFNVLKKLKTNEGRVYYQFKLLELYWKDKKKFMKYIIILFYELKSIEGHTEEQMKLLSKVEKVLSKCDTKDYMMNKMGNLLKPLDYWNHQKNLFDPWQKEVIQFIKKNESVVVRAPTSSGKSFIAMACGVIHHKILYICPAKPVAYQVGANFISMGYKVHFLLDNISHFSYSPQTNIFIGTPSEVEDNLIRNGVSYDYVVFDEIHNINKEEDGDKYENLIKLIPCNFLALSATINNSDFLVDKLKQIKPRHKINYIEYNQRFINHQRWIWKNEGLKKLHPLCVFNGMEDDLSESHLSFTPNDCSILWNVIYEVFEDIDDETNLLDGCSPDEYFTEERLLTLDDCREYEYFLKKKMEEWNHDYPKEIQEIFNSFRDKPDEKVNDNIVGIIREAKQRNMFPMIMFNTDEIKCKELFHSIYNYLSNKEMEEYPYHYDILEKKESLYQTYQKERESFKDTIKIVSTNPQFEIKEKMEIFDRKQKSIYIKKVIEYYQSKLNDIQKNEEITDNIREVQEANLTGEMNKFIVNPDFTRQDIFRKHPDFIFTNSNEPMSADTIRSVRSEIKKTLGLKIPYESALFQMLKRGIGIFLENMPDEYNWQLQKLLSKKEIGVVISDRTLCLGIDLPVKTTCFLGLKDSNHFTKDEYLQMAGRAGRRGKDTQGNIIFFGDLDYLSLIRSKQPNIEGTNKPIYDNYRALPPKYFNSNVFKNMFHKEREYKIIQNASMVEEGRKLLWFTREYSNACYFISNLFTIEKELYTIQGFDRNLYLLKKLSSLICDYNFSETIEDYKAKKIRDFKSIVIFREYITVLVNIYNSIRKDKFMILIKTTRTLFNDINHMIFAKII
tara:strand:- start:6642 stop:9446 length:2805 start_codon:yes stop_codon:yes gene_type:complete